jgi:tripartite-type tricarboxylate transporter receptor subunit TctC
VLDTPEWKKFCAETYSCTDKMAPAQYQAFVQRNSEEVLRFMKEFGMVK